MTRKDFLGDQLVELLSKGGLPGELSEAIRAELEGAGYQRFKTGAFLSAAPLDDELVERLSREVSDQMKRQQQSGAMDRHALERMVAAHVCQQCDRG